MIRLVLLTALLSGCAPDFVALDARWLPLRRVERSEQIHESDYYTTETPIVFTHDVGDFLALDQVHREALLTHEQVHARHQEQLGLAVFGERFQDEIGFRRAEEFAGWSAWIRYLVAHGAAPSADYVASFMASHYAGAFSVEEARAWAEQEIKAAGK